MENIETMYDTAKLLIEASNQIRSGLADAGLSLDECPKIKKAFRNIGVAIDDLQDKRKCVSILWWRYRRRRNSRRLWNLCQKKMHEMRRGVLMITEFYIFGYETIQYKDGFKPIVNISFKTDDGFKFIKHVLLDHKEVEAFFRSIDVEVYEFAQIPGKEGRCFIEKDCDRYFVRRWINK